MIKKNARKTGLEFITCCICVTYYFLGPAEWGRVGQNEFPVGQNGFPVGQSRFPVGQNGFQLVGKFVVCPSGHYQETPHGVTTNEECPLGAPSSLTGTLQTGNPLARLPGGWIIRVHRPYKGL